MECGTGVGECLMAISFNRGGFKVISETSANEGSGGVRGEESMPCDLLTCDLMGGHTRVSRRRDTARSTSCDERFACRGRGQGRGEGAAGRGG